MTIKEAQNYFVETLESKCGIKTTKMMVFFDPDSKRLTDDGNIYATMLKISPEVHTYELHADLNMETKKILDFGLKSFYFIKKNDTNYGYTNDPSSINITVYDKDFDIRVQLLGGIDTWWEKIKEDYYA